MTYLEQTLLHRGLHLVSDDLDTESTKRDHMVTMQLALHPYREGDALESVTWTERQPERLQLDGLLDVWQRLKRAPRSK